jgi:protein-S-isoprenylcysteine O-methyltransferase Ste14/TRAP-type uncharacterized transport system substrate-binding protein
MKRHLLAILALPFVVVVVVPALIVWIGRDQDVRWRLEWPLALLPWAIGLALWLGGLLLTAWCIQLFARVGQGTLAPWDPTQRLVVVGPYRYVRNPMICGVLAMLLGESLILGSVFLLIWTALFWLVNHGYFLLSEEPELLRRFGEAYERYRAAVPRWVPRWSAWVEAVESLAGDTAEPGAPAKGGDTRAIRIPEPGWLWPLLIVAVVVTGLGVTVFTARALFRPGPPRVYRIHMATSTVPRRVYLAEEIRKESARHDLEIDLTTKHYGALEALHEVDSPSDIKFALVTGAVRAGDYPTVRQVAALSTEPLHVLVRPELAATGFAGLRGKRLALGPPTMASHHVAREVLAFIGLYPATAQKGGYTLDPVRTEDLYRELQRIDSLVASDRVQPLRALPDAVLFTSPVPSLLARELVQTGNYHLLPVPFAEPFCNERLNPPNAEGVQVHRSLLTQTTIPAYTYRFDPPTPAQPCSTVGVPLLLVAQSDADPEAARLLLETLYDSPLKNQIRPQPLEDQVAAFPLHPATERYLRRTDPILKPEQAAKIGPLLGGIGTLITGLIAFYSYMRLRKLKRFEAYYRDIDRIDLLARGLEMDPDFPTEPVALRMHLEARLTRLKHEILTDFADGGLQGEGLLAGLIALINDTRESLASMGAPERGRSGPGHGNLEVNRMTDWLSQTTPIEDR